MSVRLGGRRARWRAKSRAIEVGPLGPGQCEMKDRKRRISYDDFLAVVRRDCRALSGTARPSEGEDAYQYDCQLAELLPNLYSVWFVNDTWTEFVKYNDPAARAIRAEELAPLPFVQSRLDHWLKGADFGPITGVSAIVLRCTGCQRRLLVDGVHRTMWLLGRGEYSAPVRVTELSGSRWPVGTPDLNVVCRCPRG